MQEEELKSAAAARLNEVLADVEARVQSGSGTAASGAGGHLYNRLAAAVEAIQEGLVERDVEVRCMRGCSSKDVLQLLCCIDWSTASERTHML